MEGYIKGKSYTSNYVNSKRTKVAHEMQKESSAKTEALKKRRDSMDYTKQRASLTKRIMKLEGK